MRKRLLRAVSLALAVAAIAIASVPADAVPGNHASPVYRAYVPIVLSSTSPTPTPTNILVNPGFEQGFSGWTTGGSPQLSTFAHTGSYSAFLGGYNNSVDGIAQLITIPACAQSALIEYWYYPIAHPNNWSYVDDLKMTLTDASNLTLTQIVRIDNYMPAPPANGTWQERQTSSNLSAYQGHEVIVELDAITGPTSLSSWYVDDVLITFSC